MECSLAHGISSVTGNQAATDGMAIDACEEDAGEHDIEQSEAGSPKE